VRAVPGKSKDVHVVGLRPLAAAYANVGPVVVQNQQVGLCLVHILVPHLQVLEKCYIIHIAIFCSRGKDVFDGAVLGDIRLDALPFKHDHGGNHITKGIGHADERGHIMLAPRTDFMDLLGSTACQHSARLRVHEHPCFISIPDAVGGNIVGRNQVVEVVEVSHNGIARYRATRSIQAGALSISNLRVSLPEPLQPSLCQGLGSRPSKVDMNLGGDSEKHCRSNCHIAILHVEHPLLHALFAFCRESCLDTPLVVLTTP